MIEYNKKKPLISIHIPKTAGTSFRKILSSWYGDKLFFHYFDEPNNKMPEKHKLLPGSCIHGHFNTKRSFGIAHYYAEADQFITILRDPFDILLSYYYYIKAREICGISYRDGKPTMLPDDINTFLSFEIENPDYSPNFLDYFPKEINYQNFREVINECFVFIGFVDQFQYDIERLAIILGFQSRVATNDNRSPRFGKVDLSLRKKFIDCHPLEYEVYHYAKTHFL